MIFLLLASVALTVSAGAADLSRQPAIEVTVLLGTGDGALVFKPDRQAFEAGRLYKLVLENPSAAKHYFSAPAFAAAVWTRKVETAGAEIKGAIREIELKPRGRAEWFFVPVQAGVFPLKCTIEGHAEAGMVGVLTIR